MAYYLPPLFYNLLNINTLFLSFYTYKQGSLALCQTGTYSKITIVDLPCLYVSIFSVGFGSSALYGTGPMLSKLMNGEKVSTQEFINTVIISTVAFSGGTKELVQLLAGSKEANMILKSTIESLNTVEMRSALAMTGYVILPEAYNSFLNDKTASAEDKLNFLFNIALVVNAVKFNKRMETLTEKYGKEKALLTIARENNKTPDRMTQILKVIDDADELVAGNFLGAKYVSRVSKAKSNIAEASGQGKHYQNISSKAIKKNEVVGDNVQEGNEDDL